MIRRATKQDAKACIDLLNLAMEDIAYTLSGTSNQEQSDEILRRFFVSDVNRLSYQNVYVFENHGIVVGAICGYFGGDLFMLDEPIFAHLKSLKINKFPEAECKNDEFYIDSIAVDESCRGQGIATKLIKFIFDELDFNKFALIVDEKKPKTKAFYEKLGFKHDSEVFINNHRYFHLVKEKK